LWTDNQKNRPNYTSNTRLFRSVLGIKTSPSSCVPLKDSGRVFQRRGKTWL
jgi:hypothetical protein